MNEQEAMETLERLFSDSTNEDYPFTECFAEALTIAIQDLEKQIPKKPIMKQYFEDSEEKYLCCPTCGEILTDRIPADNKTFYFHCMNCGLKFDWGDSE